MMDILLLVIILNVKNLMFEKDNKQNVFVNTSLEKGASMVKPRANIGEEIRKKLKIGLPTPNPISVLMPKDMNIRNENKQKVEEYCKNGRQNLMQRSVDLGRDTSRSVKSVRFEEKSNEPKLARKHSTSSILKNNRPVKKARFSDKLSMNNSICSNILKDDQSTENLSFNKSFKQKYQRQFEALKKMEKKYNDQLFPQILSSISRAQSHVFKQLKWMRLSELFSGKYLTVWDANDEVRIHPGHYCRNNLLSNCFNTLKHNNFILEKMFESQAYNPNGIYYVKINQNNTWKYVMVDDYIPVFYEDKKPISALLGVTGANVNRIQLWPFLLQKAYAKYYSNYECLDLGNEIDFMQELTGCYPEEMDPSTHDFEQICHEVNNCDSILMGIDRDFNSYPIVPRKASLTCQDPFANYAPLTLTAEQFKQKFSKIYCILLHKYFYTGFCTVKYNSSKAEVENQTSIRMIKVDEPTQCVFTVVQKDAKHYYLGDYRYAWVRLVVAMKESDKNYRWVGGAYVKEKYANVSLWLEPAQYYVFVIPEWKSKGCDLGLTFQGNIKVNIERKPYLGNENILIEAAMDLAQSKGKLKQLNQNICTYSYIDYKIGLIIENINNERPNGVVRVLRSIQGLQNCGESQIKAYNKQFALSHTVQMKIESLQHFTVVLAVQGGVNRGFLEQFDFGS